MQAVKLHFPLARSAGNLYLAQRAFPHSKTWVGQAQNQVALEIKDDSLLGLAFSYDFNDKELPKVAESLKQLESADFSMCTFSSGVLSGLAESKLVELRLDFAAISGKDLEVIGKIQSLETIWLTGASVRDEQLLLIKDLPSLTSLTLKSTSLTSHALANLCKGFESLKRLHLPASIDDSGPAYLSEGRSRINELDISYSKISNCCAPHLAQLGLETLYLNDTEIGDDALSELSQSKTLKVLFLNGTLITDKGLNHLENLTTLEHLELRDTRITEIGAARLRSKLKDCAVFS